MTNIERFNKVAAALFKVLYEKFPTPIVRFDVESLREPAGLPPPEPNAHFSDLGSTVKWLADEGFIRYGSANFDRHFTMVVLSQKGLEAMNRVPDTLEPKVTVGERLKELGREASVQTVGALVQLAITGSAAAFAAVKN